MITFQVGISFLTHIKKLNKGGKEALFIAGEMSQSANPTLAVIGIRMGISLYTGCFTSHRAPYLCPKKAVEGDPRLWDLYPNGSLRRASNLLVLGYGSFHFQLLWPFGM